MSVLSSGILRLHRSSDGIVTGKRMTAKCEAWCDNAVCGCQTNQPYLQSMFDTRNLTPVSSGSQCIGMNSTYLKTNGFYNDCIHCHERILCSEISVTQTVPVSCFCHCQLSLYRKTAFDSPWWKHLWLNMTQVGLWCPCPSVEGRKG